MTHGASTVVNAKETVDKFHEAARDADLHSAALKLRLGPDHPVPTAYETAWIALAAASSAVTLAHGLGAIDTKDAWDRLKASEESFSSAQTEFIDQAHRLVGADVEQHHGVGSVPRVSASSVTSS